MLKATLLLGCVGLTTLALVFEPRSPIGSIDDDAAGGGLVTVGRGSIHSRLVVRGELRATRSTTISSRLSSDQGKIVFIRPDGAAVEKGDVLVEFDRAPFEAAARLADIEVERKAGLVQVRSHAAEWESAQAQQRIRSAEFEVELARLELHRFENGEGPLELARLQAEASAATRALADQQLFVDELTPLLEQGYVQEAEIDRLIARREESARTAELASKQAAAFEDFIFPSRVAALNVAVQRAQAALADTQKSSASKVLEAEAGVQLAERELTSARATLAEAGANLEQTTLVAPTEGMVVLTEDFRNGERREPRIGDAVWQGQQIAFLPDLTQFEVASHVREVDLHRVEKEDVGVARFDAYPGLEIDARVRSLGVLAGRNTGVGAPSGGGEKSFTVTIDLLATDRRLRPGMTVRVEIRSGDAEDVLLLPIAALWEDEGEAWCWTLGEQGLERRALRVGIRDHQAVEVIDGLREGEQVSLYGPEPGSADRAK